MSNQPISAVTRTSLYYGAISALVGYCTIEHIDRAAHNAVGRYHKLQPAPDQGTYLQGALCDTLGIMQTS